MSSLCWTVEVFAHEELGLGAQDKLSKRRLQRRRFCFVRHPPYKELIEPEEKTCASYLDPKRKEFWRTDVDNVLKREMKEKKDRYKVQSHSPPAPPRPSFPKPKLDSMRPNQR
jgi:hypothetical protein